MRPFVRTWQAWKDSQAILRVYTSQTDGGTYILLGFCIHEIRAEGIVFRGAGNHMLVGFTHTEIDLIELLEGPTNEL